MFTPITKSDTIIRPNDYVDRNDDDGFVLIGDSLLVGMTMEKAITKWPEYKFKRRIPKDN